MAGKERGRTKRKSSTETARKDRHSSAENIANFFAPANQNAGHETTSSTRRKSGTVDGSNAGAASGEDVTVQRDEEIISLLDSPPRYGIENDSSVVVICEEEGDHTVEVQDHSQRSHSTMSTIHRSQILHIAKPHSLERSGSSSGCNNDGMANNKTANNNSQGQPSSSKNNIRSSSGTAGNFGALITAKGDCGALSWWVRSFSSVGYRNALPQARRTPGIGMYRMAWGKRVTLGLASFNTNIFGGGRIDAEAVAVATPLAGSAPNTQQAHSNMLALMTDHVANKSILGMELSVDDRDVLRKLQSASVSAQKLLLALKHACHPMCGDTNYAQCRYQDIAHFPAQHACLASFSNAACIDKALHLPCDSRFTRHAPNTHMHSRTQAQTATHSCVNKEAPHRYFHQSVYA
jgi:hypothetical protein